MEAALRDTEGMPPGFTVTRTGPFENGSFDWIVELAKGTSLNGETFWVVNHGGASPKLRRSYINVTSTLVCPASHKLGGHALDSNVGTQKRKVD